MSRSPRGPPCRLPTCPGSRGRLRPRRCPSAAGSPGRWPTGLHGDTGTGDEGFEQHVAGAEFGAGAAGCGCKARHGRARPVSTLQASWCRPACPSPERDDRRIGCVAILVLQRRPGSRAAWWRPSCCPPGRCGPAVTRRAIGLNRPEPRHRFREAVHLRFAVGRGEGDPQPCRSLRSVGGRIATTRNPSASNRADRSRAVGLGRPDDQRHHRALGLRQAETAREAPGERQGPGTALGLLLQDRQGFEGGGGRGGGAGRSCRRSCAPGTSAGR